MSGEYREQLDELRGIFMHVKFTTDRRDVIDCAVVLLVRGEGGIETIRLYDGVHGKNEMHRYTRTGDKTAGRGLPSL